LLKTKDKPTQVVHCLIYKIVLGTGQNGGNG